MNILVIGSGGREHALAWKLSHSATVERVFCLPGNAGTALDAENVDIPADDIPRLLKFARENGFTIKLIARAFKEGNRIYGFVAPQFIDANSPFAAVRNEYNAVQVEGAFA